MRRISLANAEVVFTTRRGGVSKPPFDSLNLGLFTDDDAADVDANLRSVRERLGLEGLRLLHQVHAATVVESGPAESPFVEADGHYTSEPQVGLLVTGADCPPVALAAPGRVALLHCGWRPLAAGIVEQALELFEGSAIEAAIGPGIGPRHYEVGDEVVEQLGADGQAAFADGRLDLHAVIEAKLRRGGVDHIERVDDCTFADADNYFSHRRDGAATGRQAGVAWLT